MGFSKPKIQPPPPPPAPPTRADASVFVAGQGQPQSGLRTLINTGSRGLIEGARTRKRTLLGGGA
jgi:hypothetical protein